MMELIFEQSLLIDVWVLWQRTFVCFSNVLTLQIKSRSINKFPEHVSLLIFDNWVPSNRNLLWAVSGERECGRRGRRSSVDWNFHLQSRWEIKVQSRWAFHCRVFSRIYLEVKMVCAFERKYGFLCEQGTLQNTAFRIWFSNERLSFALFPKNCPQTMAQTMFLLSKVKKDCFCWKHKLTSTQDGGYLNILNRILYYIVQRPKLVRCILCW